MARRIKFAGVTRLALGLVAIAAIAVLNGCAPYPRLMGFPYNANGQTANSPAAETDPETTGRYLVFASDRAKSQDIYLYDIEQRRLIDLPGLNSLNLLASDPDISQDGRYITFLGSRQGRSGIYLYDRQTQQLRNLTQNLDAEVRHPSISANGERIAFESSAIGQWDIFIYNRAGQPIDRVPMDPR